MTRTASHDRALTQCADLQCESQRKIAAGFAKAQCDLLGGTETEAQAWLRRVGEVFDERPELRADGEVL